MYVTLILMCYQAVKRYDEFGNFYDIKLKTIVDYSVSYGSTNHLIFAITTGSHLCEMYLKSIRNMCETLT